MSIFSRGEKNQFITENVVPEGSDGTRTGRTEQHTATVAPCSSGLFRPSGGNVGDTFIDSPFTPMHAVISVSRSSGSSTAPQTGVTVSYYGYGDASCQSEMFSWFPNNRFLG